MTEEKTKSTRNRRERVIGFTYVSLLFIVTTIACCICLFYYYDTRTGTQKEFAIAKMDRIRQFQIVQSEQMIIVDSVFNKIKELKPDVQASYEENDIKYYLNDIKNLYEKNSYDKRCKIFSQVSDFYTMWFADRKELWSIRQNIDKFRKNLEACEIGLQKKTDELKNTK